MSQKTLPAITAESRSYKIRGSKNPLYSHGMSETRFYSIWENIKSRTGNPKEKSYVRYGALGIKCSWKSFNEFKTDMLSSYEEHVKKFGEKNTQIDRINSKGNYAKENCRWSTIKEQQNNKKNTIFITYKGRTLPLNFWAQEINIKAETIRHRIMVGWPTHDVLTRKPRKYTRTLRPL